MYIKADIAFNSLILLTASSFTRGGGGGEYLSTVRGTGTCHF